jgi:uncharacterized membrane protein YeaQ/YmgE (transglycosylase-associated protein family)
VLAIVSWIGIGAVLGVVSPALSPEAFPAGRVGALMAGAAGGFVGGGLFALVADKGTAKLGLPSLAAAAVTAVVVLVATRKAQYAEPRPQ